MPPREEETQLSPARCAEILWRLEKNLPKDPLPLAQSHFVRMEEPTTFGRRPDAAQHTQASGQIIVIKKCELHLDSIGWGGGAG